MKNLFKNTKSSPHGADKNQQKAFFNIFRFFAIMLVLTFLARGTAGATLAKVTLTSVAPNSVTNQINVDGKLEFANTVKIITPPNLQVEELLPEPSDTLEQGQKIVLFNKKTTDLSVKTEIAALKKLQVQYSNIQSTLSHDDSKVRSAKDNLNRANQERTETYTNNSLTVDIATRRYDNALKNLNRLKEWPSQDRNEIPAAEERLNLAKDEVKIAQQAADELLAAAEYAVLQAELNLANEEQNFNDSIEESNQLTASNYAEAQLLLIDIEAKKVAITEMQQIQKNSYYLLAKQSGRLTSWNISEGQLTTNVIGTISDKSDGYIFTFPLTKKQSDLVGSDTKLSLTQKNNVFDSTISHITPQDNDDSFYAVAKVPAEQFNRGTAQATVTLFEKDYPMCVPSGAINRDNNGGFVYVVEEKHTILGLSNVVARIEITILEQSADTVAISGSLFESKIIMSTTKALKVGDRVRIVQ